MAEGNRTYKKTFIPLESDPEVFNELLRHLGVSPRLVFEEVLSLDEPELLPHPAAALILLFPDADEAAGLFDAEDKKTPPYDGEKDDDVVWFRQTIHNACGVYALLHAVANAPGDDKYVSDSSLQKMFNELLPLRPAKRAEVVENSIELEEAYSKVARKGQTAAPDLDVTVDFHYICFAKARDGKLVYRLDGDRNGPQATSVVLEKEDDLLTEKMLNYLRRVMQARRDSLNFSIMALVEKERDRM